MKRVVIDARMVGKIPHGFARYVSRLAEGLEKLREQAGLAYEPLFLTGSETPAGAFGFPTLPVGAPFLNPRELFEIPVLLRKLGAAAYHSPTFSSLLSVPRGLASPCPWIVTIHDLNHLMYGGWKERVYYRKLLRPFALKASAVVTVSEFSRSEIARWSEIPEEKIRIVSNAMDDRSFHPPTEEEAERVLQKHGLRKGRYFLCLSNSKPHKNVDLLVEAYRGLPKRASSDAWPLVLSLRREESSPGLRALGPIEDEDGRILTSCAGAVVFPSLYEGFGLPPVEAASVGVSVIVSKIPPHLEGLRDLGPEEATWVDPRDREGWTQAMARAEKGGLRAPSMESRARIVSRFDTLKMARDMDLVYARVLGLPL